MNARTDSGSRRSCSAVEPARSAKRIVTTLRASDRGAAGWESRAGGTANAGAVTVGPSVAPHSLQKREPGGGVAPQLGQASASRAPHSLQNVDPAGGVDPHRAQVTMPASS